MNRDIESLLNTCLELEGLLCLINRRGDTIPENVIDLVKTKVRNLDNGINQLFESNASLDSDDEPIESQSEATACEAVMEEQAADATAIADNLEFEEAMDADSANELKIDTTEEQPATLTLEQQEIVDTVELEEELDADVELPEPTPEPEVKPAETEEKPAADIKEPVAINDVVPIELTLNDKFRFRRELFANSDVDLADALQVASRMSSAADVEDYFYNDLCFDPENEAVKDFMRIVTSRFK